MSRLFNENGRCAVLLVIDKISGRVEWEIHPLIDMPLMEKKKITYWYLTNKPISEQELQEMIAFVETVLKELPDGDVRPLSAKVYTIVEDAIVNYYR